ncbi:MAG: hypothetical protein GF317_06020 [Candidatus Lokiarchaeota archaeon]|nr:hypothetical protein [Candidatus Lokiarchaeota archaeon]
MKSRLTKEENIESLVAILPYLSESQKRKLLILAYIGDNWKFILRKVASFIFDDKYEEDVPNDFMSKLLNAIIYTRPVLEVFYIIRDEFLDTDKSDYKQYLKNYDSPNYKNLRTAVKYIINKIANISNEEASEFILSHTLESSSDSILFVKYFTLRGKECLSPVIKLIEHPPFDSKYSKMFIDFILTNLNLIKRSYGLIKPKPLTTSDLPEHIKKDFRCLESSIPNYLTEFRDNIKNLSKNKRIIAVKVHNYFIRELIPYFNVFDYDKFNINENLRLNIFDESIILFGMETFSELFLKVFKNEYFDKNKGYIFKVNKTWNHTDLYILDNILLYDLKTQKEQSYIKLGFNPYKEQIPSSISSINLGFIYNSLFYEYDFKGDDSGYKKYRPYIHPQIVEELTYMLDRIIRKVKHKIYPMKIIGDIQYPIATVLLYIINQYIETFICYNYIIKEEATLISDTTPLDIINHTALKYYTEKLDERLLYFKDISDKFFNLLFYIITIDKPTPNIIDLWCRAKIIDTLLGKNIWLLGHDLHDKKLHFYDKLVKFFENHPDPQLNKVYYLGNIRKQIYEYNLAYNRWENIAKCPICKQNFEIDYRRMADFDIEALKSLLGFILNYKKESRIPFPYPPCCRCYKKLSEKLVGYYDDWEFDRSFDPLSY